MLRRVNNSGFTLVEMVIAVAIMGSLVVILAGFTLNGLTSYAYLINQSNATTDVSTTVGRMNSVLRGTTSVISASNNAITIYGYFSPRDAVPDKIRYFISGTNLKAGTIAATGTSPNYVYDASTEVITNVASYLVMGANNLFSYYDDNGNALATGFNVSQIRQIGVYVATNPKPTLIKVPIAISSRVTLRNAKTNL